MLLVILLDHFSGVLGRIWLPEEGLELVMSCVIRNDELTMETAIFLKKEGMELEMKKGSVQINDLPAIGAPSIAHNLQYTPEKTNDCQSILPSIKKEVSTTIKLGKPVNDCSPIMKSPAVLHIFQF